MVDAHNHYREPSPIDYRKFAYALDHYESLGYGYVEVPWVVSHDSVAVTLPDDRVATAVQYGDLVGSGEQSYIELMRRGHAITKACCITPCFRMEPDYDELHHAYFMKLELINTDANEGSLRQMITDATALFEHYTPTDIEQTGPDMYDIVDKKRRIELGSYGFRTAHGQRFIYGTGLALPRLDTAISLQDQPGQTASSDHH